MMFKKKIVAVSLTMAMLPSIGVLANEANSVYIDLSADADMFLKTSVTARKDYIDGNYYFNGESYQEFVEYDDIDYRLYTDASAMDSKVNDVKVIDSDAVEIELNSSASRAVGLLLFARGAQENKTVEVELKYENNAVEKYSKDIFDMTETGNEETGTTALEVVKIGLTYKPVEVEGKSVYLHSVVIDTSESVNKSVNLKSITLPAADFTYYVAAVTQVNYTEEELEEITRGNIKELYKRYSEADFKQVAEGENGLLLSKAEELKQSLISQQGKMEEATEENIQKISLLVEGAILYSSVIECRDCISELEEKYLDISADFEELNQTALTDDDYKELEKLIGMYDEYTALDIDRLNEIAEYYGVEVDAEIDLSNKDKIQALYNAYSKALLRDELKNKIEQYYSIYIAKDISEITSDDEESLLCMLEAFDEAEENGIEFKDYNSDYIKHLYNDYEKYQTSENGYAVDISKSYNADTIGNAGESVNPDTWYESKDNISGTKFIKASYHNNISSYDSQSSTLSVKEYQYTETGNTDSPYKFTSTGYNIPFTMPEEVFSGSVCDAVLLKANEKYTVNMNNVYTDKIYLLMSGEESNVSADILYNDGTEEAVAFKMNRTSQLAGKVSKKEYENLVSYITAGDYSEYGKSDENLIYKVSGNVTVGLGVFAIEPDSQKGVASLTLKSTTKNTAVYGISVMPEKNDAVIEYAEKLYNEIVTDEGIDSSDKNKAVALVMAYDECKRRGLYSSVIKSDVLAELNNMVLTASGEIYRENKDYAKTEIYFSVPVDEESAKEALSVTVNGDTKDDYAVSFDELSKIMTVSVPIGKEKVQSLCVDVASTVKIAKYPNLTMMYPFGCDTAIEAYITAEYKNGTVNLANSSKTSQDYIVYVQASDNEKIYSVNTSEGTLKGLKEDSVQLLLSAYPGTSVLSAAVLDKISLAPLCEITPIPVCEENTVNDAQYTEPSFDLLTNTLKINGFTPSLKENAAVSVIVSASGTDIYCGGVKTNKDGYFCFEIPVDGKKVSAGKLEIKLGGDDFAEYELNDNISFSDNMLRKTFVNSLKNATTKSEVKSILSGAKEALSMSFKPFEHIMQDSDLIEKLAERMLKVNDEIEAVKDSDSSAVIGKKAAAVQTLIKQQSVLACIEAGEKDLYADATSLLYNDLMGYSSIDSDGVTLYKLFAESITEKGQNAVIDAISSKSFDDCAELYDELKKAIMLNALIYPSTSGIGYVEKVLTKQNADAVDIAITKYLNLKDKSEASAHIANMSITSLKDVTDYIAKLGSKNPVTGGNGGGGSAGVGVSPGNASWNGSVNTSDTKQENAQISFSDLPGSHWGYNQVMELNKNGIISGYGDGTFGTDKTITRAEFIKLVCLVKGIEPAEYEDIFQDVASDDWYASYVCAAYKKGIVNGISDTEFGADMPVSRQDICVILYRSDDITSDIAPEFNDSEEIADYAKEAVGYFSKNGIINGFDGNVFRPTEKASRVQAAAIIYNYMNR